MKFALFILLFLIQSAAFAVTCTTKATYKYNQCFYLGDYLESAGGSINDCKRVFSTRAKKSASDYLHVETVFVRCDDGSSNYRTGCWHCMP